MSATFLGPPDAQLFARFHPGRGRPGVLVCPPPGPGGLRFHRPLRRLCEQLAGRGLAVLRFDFRGTGDAAGDFCDADLETWSEDLRRAADALVRMAGCARIGLLGLRLGASLACRLAAERSDVAALLLWDPVADGEAWLAGLRREQQRMLATAHVRGGPPEPGELLGFDWSPRLLAGVEALDLCADAASTPPCLVLETDPALPLGKVAEHLGARLERRPDPALWRWYESFRGAVPRPSLLRRCVAWLDEELR